MTYRLAFVFAGIIPVALSAAHAQVIAVKTAPIADGGQFAFLPSANLGMGGLSIALADSSRDPFTNPAKGARLSGMRVFGAPTFFSATRKAGSGLTLPLGTSVSSGPWFTQIVIAMQDVDRTEQNNNFINPLAARADGLGASSVVAADDGKASRQNRYVSGMLGRRLANGLSVASSASWWRLNALDGVDLNYPTSFRVQQHGDALDVRVGILKELGPGHSLEAVAVHNRFAVNQDVAFMDTFWDPTLRQIKGIPRVEPNADRTDTWGVHVGYMRPLASDSSVRLGAILTANRIRQPSLPGYELPEVPGDAGRAQAYNVGAGLVRSIGPLTMGLDAIYEPIWSRTWVRADDATEARDGTTLNAGSKLLDNQFRFNNGIARAGLAVVLPFSKEQTVTFEGGGQMRAIRYRLEQSDAVQQTEASSSQHWNEWTRTWGVSIRFMGATAQYRGSLTTGAGRNGFDDNGGVIVVDALPPNATTRSFAPFPGIFGLTFADVRTTTHQISFSVPIR